MPNVRVNPGEAAIRLRLKLPHVGTVYAENGLHPVRDHQRRARVLWAPGKGPVPVDPDWKFDPAALTVPKRDLITALAVNELAEMMGDRTIRKTLTTAATKAMHDAVDRISQQR